MLRFTCLLFDPESFSLFLHEFFFIWLIRLPSRERYLYENTVIGFRTSCEVQGIAKPKKEIQNMKEKIQRRTPKPVLHGFLFGNGMFVTPAEMKIMQSLGIIPTTKA